MAEGLVTEVACPLSELHGNQACRVLACRLGLADASVVFAAERYQALLLSDEKTLFSAYSAGTRFEILLLDEYLRQTD